MSESSGGKSTPVRTMPVTPSSLGVFIGVVDLPTTASSSASVLLARVGVQWTVERAQWECSGTVEVQWRAQLEHSGSAVGVQAVGVQWECSAWECSGSAVGHGCSCTLFSLSGTVHDALIMYTRTVRPALLYSQGHGARAPELTGSDALAPGG